MNWIGKPPRLRRRLRASLQLPPDNPLWQDLVRQVQDWETLGVVTRCRSKYILLSRLFPVPKPDGTARPILDLRFLNSFVRKLKFKMENFIQLVNLLQPGCYLMKIDIANAFWHLRIPEKFQKFFTFQFLNQHFSYQSMMFGWTSAPRLFTLLMRAVATHLRRQGIVMLVFVDDILVIGATKEICRRSGQALVDLLIDLGFLIKPSKCILSPTTRLEYLGVVVDTQDFTFKILPRKRKSILARVKRTYNALSMHSKHLASLVGQLVALEHVEVRAREKVRFMLELIRSIPARRRYKSMVKLTPQCKEELLWWRIRLGTVLKRPIRISEPTIQITTDASPFGVGGWIMDIASKKIVMQVSQPIPVELLPKHITFQELRAAVLVLTQAILRLDLRATTVLLRSDNICALAYLRRRASRLPQLNDLCRPLWDLLESRNLQLIVQHLPGLINHLADRLSRQFDRSEWKLRWWIFRRIKACFPFLSVDLFASKTNHLLPTFCSMDGAGLGSAWEVSWSQLSHHGQLLIHPPFSMLARILSRLQRETLRNTALIILPWWPSASWFPLLMDLLVEWPCLLPKDCLEVPTQARHWYSKLQMTPWDTVLVQVSSRSGDNRRFLRQVFECDSHQRKRKLLSKIMTMLGVNSWNGIDCSLGRISQDLWSCASWKSLHRS
jgi:hypothetical protein